MRTVYLNCSCGGGASVTVESSATTAVAECACGKMLLASFEPEEQPPTLGLSVGDGVQTHDKFGG